MPSMNTISADKLARLIRAPNSPALVDVRTDDDYKADPRLIPGRMSGRIAFAQTAGCPFHICRPAIPCEHNENHSFFENTIVEETCK
jgi:hypothetical protein